MEKLNEHAKSIGSDKVIISASSSKIMLSDKCNKCDNKAEYNTNFIGIEKNLCPFHAEKFLDKNKDLPNDLWYCKKK